MGSYSNDLHIRLGLAWSKKREQRAQMRKAERERQQQRREARRGVS